MEELTKAKCPECKAIIKLEDDLEEGDVTFCPDCDAELEIVSMNPLVVILAGGGIADYDEIDAFEEEDFDDSDFDDDF